MVRHVWRPCGREPPETPENSEKCVGIDVGILTYAHNSEWTAVGPLNLTDERDRLEREQRKLSRKQHGSKDCMQIAQPVL